MYIAHDNKADAATLSASSEQSTLPASNVQDPRLAKKWYTAAGTTSATLVLDLLSSLSCGILALLGTNLTSSATIRIRGSDSDATGATGEKYDSGTVSAGVDDDYDGVYKAFTAASARYWRIDIADATVAEGLLMVGRLFLGPKWTPGYGQSWRWAPDVDDPSDVKESTGGQVYAEELPKKRRLSFSLDWLTEAEAMANAQALRRACGVTRGVLVVPMESGSYIPHQALWGRMTARSAPVVNELNGKWSQKFDIEELL